MIQSSFEYVVYMLFFPKRLISLLSPKDGMARIFGSTIETTFQGPN